MYRWKISPKDPADFDLMSEFETRRQCAIETMNPSRGYFIVSHTSEVAITKAVMFGGDRFTVEPLRDSFRVQRKRYSRWLRKKSKVGR